MAESAAHEKEELPIMKKMDKAMDKMGKKDGDKKSEKRMGSKR